MNNDPVYCIVHVISDPSQERTFTIPSVLCSLLFRIEEHDVVVTEDCIIHNYEGIHQEKQEERMEENNDLVEDASVVPVVRLAADLLPQKVLIERMTDEQFVIVPESNVPGGIFMIIMSFTLCWRILQNPLNLLHILATVE